MDLKKPEMVQICYKGAHRAMVRMPGFLGYLKPGEQAQTTKQNWETELKQDKRWELVDEKKPAKKAEVNTDG